MTGPRASCRSVGGRAPGRGAGLARRRHVGSLVHQPARGGIGWWQRLGSVVGAAVLALGLSAPVTAQDAARGKVIYEKWCAGCHGMDGAGDGPAAHFMLPPPRDFTRGLYQIRTTASGELPTDDDLRRVLELGMPGTAMPEWKTLLSDRERDDVIAYIKSFSTFFKGAAPAPLDFGKAAGRDADAVADGKTVYQKLECFKCHGDQGRGDGPSAPTLRDDWKQPIRAANLAEPWNFNGGPTMEDVYHRLRTGLDGTPMPSFGDVVEAKLITPEQLWHLAAYVRSLGPENVPPRVSDVIEAIRVDGPLPTDPDDSAWGRADAAFIPLVGQVLKKPRWFAPRVDGVWVKAMHNGQQLAMRFTWSDPSASPSPEWQQWQDVMAATMSDVDGAIPTAQGPDRFHVQFPLALTEGLERPFFVEGDRQRHVYLWRWASQPDTVEEGTAGGVGTFVAAGSGETAHRATFDAGQWRLQISRALVPRDTATAVPFVTGRAIPIAFYAADGSNGEGEMRGSLTAWYAVYLDQPTPVSTYTLPVAAMLLTAGLGVMVVWRAQQRDRKRRATSTGG